MKDPAAASPDAGPQTASAQQEPRPITHESCSAARIRRAQVAQLIIQKNLFWCRAGMLQQGLFQPLHVDAVAAFIRMRKQVIKCLANTASVPMLSQPGQPFLKTRATHGIWPAAVDREHASAE